MGMSTMIGIVPGGGMKISTDKALLIIALTLALLGCGGYAYLTAGDRSGETTPSEQVPKPAVEAKAFFDAVQAGNVAEAGTVLSTHPQLLGFRFGPEGTALHVAARCNRPEMIKFLLDKGADVNVRGQWDGTPLHWAAWWGSKNAVEELLKRGAPVEARGDIFGSTPLLWTAHGSANLRNPNGDYRATAEALIGAGAAADTRNKEGVPAVMIAGKDVAEVLIAHGARVPNGPATRPTVVPAPGTPV